MFCHLICWLFWYFTLQHDIYEPHLWHAVSELQDLQKTNLNTAIIIQLIINIYNIRPRAWIWGWGYLATLWERHTWDNTMAATICFHIHKIQGRTLSNTRRYTLSNTYRWPWNTEIKDDSTGNQRGGREICKRSPVSTCKLDIP